MALNATVINTMGPAPVIERYVLNYSDLTAAATSQTISLRAVPKGSLVLGVRVLCVTPFSGGSISALTLSVGSSGGAVNTFLAASTIFTGVTGGTTFYVTSTKGLNAGAYAADTITITLTSTTDNLNAATAGKCYIDLVLLPFEDLTATAPAGNSTTGGGLL